tara:strand:- start:2033 stop:2803 length:771 start_codon:yes stop_codon:yes gene_type:complete
MIVQSLWIGDSLTDMEVYCIKSFQKHGFKFHLYTYGKVKRIPNGTIIKDGNLIIPKNDIFQLKNTYLPFSDIWRYKLLYEKGGYWVDMDMICMQPFEFKEPYIFSSERTIKEGAYKMTIPYVANIGILKAPKGSIFYRELYETCMSFHNKQHNKDKIKYMRLLRTMIEKYNFKKYIKPPHYFCHLDWWYAKDAFMPIKKFRPKYGHKGKSIDSMFSNRVYTIHLWRDLVTKKYKLDTNGVYPDSLWEKLNIYIDSL